VNARERAEALDRTLALMRDHVSDDASDERLLAELSGCRVVMVAVGSNASSRQGQVALITAALLCARMGLQVTISAENVALVGMHAPLTGTHLVDALVDIGVDLIPGSTISLCGAETRIDLCVLVGDTPDSHGTAAELVLRMYGDDWSGALLPAHERGEGWARIDAPFGAMAAGALVAGEAYRLVMRRLRDFTKVPIAVYDATFAPSVNAVVRLAPDGTPCPAALGDFDFISGGAITHASLYALSRIEGVTARARVVEPTDYDMANLNRYALMRRCDKGRGKAAHLAAMSLGCLHIESVAERFDESLRREMQPLAPNLLVGVDHIPSRWLAQQACRGWLGCGATEHYTTVASFHTSYTSCVACLHHTDGGVDPRAATVSFVSFWSGLWLAALYVRHVAGEQLPLSQQAVFTMMLGSNCIWLGPVQRRTDCRLACAMMSPRPAPW